MTLVRSVFTIGGYTFLSRILGFVRDIFIAAILGAGAQADAFFVAFKLPNFMRRIFAEGAFSAAFVPQFSRLLAGEGREAARKFAEEALAVLLWALLVMTALFEIGMPYFMHILAPGFVDQPAKLALTIELSRITFPYLLLISLVALLGGILNSLERFSAFASAPILMNLCLIFGITVLGTYTETPAHGLAWGVFLAGVAQLLWLVAALMRTDMRLRLRFPRMTPGVKKLLKLMLPVALGASVAQINLLIDIVLASLIPDAVSYLYYADRLNELPLGVIGIAVGTALLPMLSKQARTGDDEAARVSLNRALEIAMLLCLPACFALVIMAEPLMKVLFERGAFSAEAALQSSRALMAYALGLPAFVLIKVFAPGFFAREDTKTPVKIGLIAMGANVVLNVILMIPLAHVGLALATSISGWMNAGLLGYMLHKRGHFAPDHRLNTRLVRIVISCIAMGLVVAVLVHALEHWWSADLMLRISALAIVVVTGKLTFFAAAWLTGAAKPQDIKRLVKKTPVA